MDATDLCYLPAVEQKALLEAGELRGAMEETVARHGGVFERVRGLGLMLGIRCAVDAGEAVAAMRRRRVLTVPAGDNVMRLLPPLIVEDDHIDEAVAALDAVGRELAP